VEKRSDTGRQRPVDWRHYLFPRAWVLRLFVVDAVLFVMLGIPLMMRRVPPNQLYGCRTRRTLEDPDLWYRANELLGQHLVIGGILLAAVALANYFLFRGGWYPLLINTALMLAVVGYLAYECLTAGAGSCL
jgi:uncharacterized membrane protein